MKHKYKVEFTKGKLNQSLLKPPRAMPKEKYDRIDTFFGVDSPYSGVGGPCNHTEIPELAKRTVESWLKFDWHWSEPGEEFWAHGQDKKYLHKVQHAPVTPKNVYFRCDYPETLSRSDFWKMVAELKGAKKDSLGGLWKTK